MGLAGECSQWPCALPPLARCWCLLAPAGRARAALRAAGRRRYVDNLKTREVVSREHGMPRDLQSLLSRKFSAGAIRISEDAGQQQVGMQRAAGGVLVCCAAAPGSPCLSRRAPQAGEAATCVAVAGMLWALPALCALASCKAQPLLSLPSPNLRRWRRSYLPQYLQRGALTA